ncbi:MAG: LamG-like jellyroll fold domain-containing protein [Anaerolineales bacterium]|jgi:hypothetical protein
MQKTWIVPIGFLVVSSLSCSLFNNVIQSSSLGSSSSSSGQIIYQDNFDDQGSGWEIGSYDHGQVGYQSGRYIVTSDGNGATMWGVANQLLSDVDIEVDTAQVTAPSNDNNDYGVMCRAQDNGDGYYLLISGDGNYSILLGNGDSYDPLVDWQESSAIHTGNAANHLRAVCNGSSFDLYVNGQHLASAEDDTFSSGDLALTATSYESDGTEIHFDNLTVRQP